MTDTTTLPHDEPTAEELAAVSTIRPLEDLPSNWTVKGDPKVLAPTLSALSPSDQQTVRQRAASAEPEAINRALVDFLREKRVEVRLLTGAGEGTTAVERAALSQMASLRDMSTEVARIETELADVVSHRTEYKDGKPVAVPVYRLTGRARSAREARLDEIKHSMALVAGIEGEAEMREAARKDALRMRELRLQVAEREEVKALGEQMLRDERIKAQAETYASFRRHNLG
jgi:hypothetical protein